MILKKRQKKLWTIMIIIAGLALVLATILPVLTAIFR